MPLGRRRSQCRSLWSTRRTMLAGPGRVVGYGRLGLAQIRSAKAEGRRKPEIREAIAEVQHDQNRTQRAQRKMPFSTSLWSLRSFAVSSAISSRSPNWDRFCRSPALPMPRSEGGAILAGIRSPGLSSHSPNPPLRGRCCATGHTLNLSLRNRSASDHTTALSLVLRLRKTSYGNPLGMVTAQSGFSAMPAAQVAHGSSMRMVLTRSGVIGGAPRGATRTGRPNLPRTSRARFGCSR
jgi:hypothetical protein